MSCPPAVPVVISGEIITGKAAEVLRHCGINEISIVKYNIPPKGSSAKSGAALLIG